MAKRAEAKYVVRAVDKTRAALRSIQRNFRNTGRDMQRMGQQISMGLTLPIAAFGVAMVKSAGNFEQSMNKVQALTSASGDQFAKLQKQAKDLGRTTQFSASEAADAMGFLAQAGFEANEVLGAMPSTLQLAAAAGIDLARAADITSNILTGYGKQVEDLAHVNDVLVKTFTSSNVNLEMLGETMKYVAPVASSVGLSFEEMAAATGLLGNAGIQASMAGTSLKKTISAMINPTDAIAKKMKDMGLNVMTASGDMKPLVTILKQLEDSGADTADLLEIVGERAGPALAALIQQGSGALATLTRELAASGGTAEKVAEVQMAGFNGAVRRLKSAFEGLQIAMASSGLLEWFTNFTQRIAAWVQRFSEASSHTHKLTIKIAALAAAIGPAIFVTGKLVALFAFLLTPLGLVVTLIGGMIFAWVKWRDQTTSIVKGVIDWVSGAFKKMTGWFGTTGKAILDNLIAPWRAWGKILGPIVSTVVAWIQEAFFELVGFVHRHIAEILSGSKKLLEILQNIPGHIGLSARSALMGLEQFGDEVQVKLENLTDPEKLKADMEKAFGAITGLVEVAKIQVESWINVAAADASDFLKVSLDKIITEFKKTKQLLENLGAPIPKKLTVGDVPDQVLKRIRNMAEKSIPYITRLRDALGSVMTGVPIQKHVEKFLQLALAYQKLGLSAEDAANRARGAMADLGDSTLQETTKIKQAAVSSAESFADYFVDAVKESKDALATLGDFAAHIFDQIARAAIRQRVIGPLLESLGLINKEKGGPVSSGSAYIVGEAGPELFLPKEAGQIIPAGHLQAMVQAAHASMAIQKAIGYAVKTSAQSLRELGQMTSTIFGQINRQARSGGVIGPVLKWWEKSERRATGGPVLGGQPYLVGEQGPELFVPASAGEVVPGGGALAGAGGMNISFNITANDARGFDDLLAKRRGMIVGMIQEAYNKRGRFGPLG